MSEKDMLVDIIKHKGYCMNAFCDFHANCPLRYFCDLIKAGHKEKKQDLAAITYMTAVMVFTETYGKADLVAELI